MIVVDKCILLNFNYFGFSTIVKSTSNLLDKGFQSWLAKQLSFIIFILTNVFCKITQKARKVPKGHKFASNLAQNPQN